MLRQNQFPDRSNTVVLHKWVSAIHYRMKLVTTQAIPVPTGVNPQILANDIDWGD